MEKELARRERERERERELRGYVTRFINKDANRKSDEGGRRPLSKVLVLLSPRYINMSLMYIETGRQSRNRDPEIETEREKERERQRERGGE